MIDRLETERLVLRRPAPRDEPGYVALMTSERSRYMGGPMRPYRAWSAFAAELGHWEIRGWGPFAVTLKGEDRCLGLVGPWFPGEWPERKVGWLVWPETEGRGIAFEAARVCVDHAFRDLGWDTAVSYIDPENTRSIRLAERLGAVRDPEAARVDPEDIVFRHPRPESLT
jgi:RimJ/RimL family protein N-acetyltransferase